MEYTIEQRKKPNGYAIPVMQFAGNQSRRGITVRSMMEQTVITVGMVDVVVKADIQKKDFMCNCTTQHSSIDRV